MTKGGLLDGVLPESVLIDSLPLNNQGIKGMGAALSRINELRGGMQAGYQVCKDGRVKADLSYVGMDGRNSTEDMAEAELSAFRWAKIKGLAEVSARGVGWLIRRKVGDQNAYGLSRHTWTHCLHHRHDIQNVRAIFNRERDALPYALAIRPNTTAESQQRRRERCVRPPVGSPFVCIA